MAARFKEQTDAPVKGVVTACGIFVAAAVVVGRYSCRTGGCTAGSTRDVQSPIAPQPLSRSLGFFRFVIYAAVDMVVFHRGVLSGALCFHFGPPAVVRVASAVFNTVAYFADPRAAVTSVFSDLHWCDCLFP